MYIISKYIERIPLSRIAKIAIVEGKGRSLAQVKGNADFIMNGGFYDMGTGKPINHLKVNGSVLSRETWSVWGYAWENPKDFKMSQLPASKGNYIGGVALLTPWDGVDAKLDYPREIGGTRGRTAIALVGEELILYCSGDGTRDGATPEEVRAELYKLGAETAVLLDGGGSSQCDFQGRSIHSSRRVHNYICVWLKEPEKAEKPMGRTVVLDPGHGVETAGKRSPDGSYLEHEFNLDMAYRVRDILGWYGVRAVLTREGEHDVSLERRVDIANDIANLDLFVSLHSNASGTGWTAPAGYGIYTYGMGEDKARNIAARKLLGQAKQAGVPLWGGGLHYDPSLYVLKHTKAPAMIVEHGFHTNREEVAKLKTAAYRDKLARVDAKGILDYLGIPWVEEPAPEPEKPWYAEDQAWVQEMGVSDGTRPGDPCTRAELWAAVHRLYKAIKAGK